jgi:malate synthase
MMINALNSGARVFMADFEDALSPTWQNLLAGQVAVREAVRRTLRWDALDGKPYRLGDELATLVVRPRGWHLDEPAVRVDDAPMSGSLFDAGLYAHWSARAAVEAGAGPYLYLAKLEGASEAALWHEVFGWLEDRLGLDRGTFRATVLIETLPAAFEMDGILRALGEHATALNAGRWDYLFSVIKTHRDDPASVLADRAQVTMTVPFMRAYTERLVRTCHRRGAHAIGGMAAFIPNRRDPEVTERALARVREDKEREAGDGFDGTWVAHPDLVPTAMAAFDAVLGERPNQLERRRAEPPVADADLLDLVVPGGRVTEAGVRTNVRVGLRYLAAWLGGNGAAAIDDLMEDVATAEISRAQLWAWRRHGATIEGAGPFDEAAYRTARDAALADFRSTVPRIDEAAELLDRLVLADELAEFLTLEALARLR